MQQSPMNGTTSAGAVYVQTNAAPNEVIAFRRAPDGSIELRDRVHTGSAPRSVAEREGLVVVLNTGEPGLASFRLDAEDIAPVEGGNQKLDASYADPAQVAFST